mmetsp:Transcript_1105/g.1198  ORF Transcript_1105/g.1198 Transcript_1105/m.1198 type:complete len:112 (+) Transcript_1105:64-399(+)
MMTGTTIVRTVVGYTLVKIESSRISLSQNQNPNNNNNKRKPQTYQHQATQSKCQHNSKLSSNPLLCSVEVKKLSQHPMSHSRCTSPPALCIRIFFQGSEWVFKQMPWSFRS